MSEIKGIKGVNALKDDQSIPVSKNLSIIYGDNGVGKSGYIRILNNAFLSRGDKTLYINIYSSVKPKETSCVFKFKDTSKEYELKYPDNSKSYEFSCYSVFDSSSITAHLTTENIVQFLPNGLEFFDAFSNVITKVQELLENDIRNNSPENNFIDFFENDTTVRKLIQSLSGSTDVKTIQEKAKLSPEELSKLVKLEKDLIDLKKIDVAKKVKSLRRIQEQLVELKGDFENINEYFSDESISNYKKLIQDYKRNKELSVSEGHNLNVIICTLPRVLAKSMSIDPEVIDEHDEKPTIQKKATLDFRRMLKAATQKYKVPIQIILPSTYDTSIKTKFKVGNLAEASLQDNATIAWNFYTALYYKAGGIPWRLKRDPHDFQTGFIGISFYRTLDDTRLQSSVAQIFNERGEGMIIRGGIAKPLKDDKQIHLDSNESERLVLNSILKYKQEHKHSPARVVIHKTSDFDQDEIDGITSAMNIEKIDIFDLISLSKSITRLHRPGKYPPLRGTFWELDNENKILYTKGSVDFFQTYPGLYVPKTLKIKIAYTDQSHKSIASEILALTKMNWNNTQLDNSLPITIKAARQVGEILKYIPDDSNIESNYCYYM